MRIILLQNMLYVPCLGGANRANRLLLEGLVAKGHVCRVVVPAVGGHAIENDRDFFKKLETEGHRILNRSQRVCVFESAGVEIHSVLDPRCQRSYAIEQIASFDPDAVIVSSQDPGQSLLTAALDAAPERTVYVVHAAWDLPCGPLAAFQSAVNARRISQAGLILTVSRYLRDYLRDWAAADSSVVHFPAYGSGPFPEGCPPDGGAVGMINPSQIKGISIFESLARCFPENDFAAVPTWATTSEDLTRLRGLRNVRLIEPTEDTDALFVPFRILLVPSLLPDGFGLVAVEAMLRGIPVLASDAGGLPEAKLGVDYVLPVRPIERYAEGFDERRSRLADIPEQDIVPWKAALSRLLSEPGHYESVSLQSRKAAREFVSNLSVAPFERHLSGLRRGAVSSGSIVESGALRAEQAREERQSMVGNMSAERRSAVILQILKRRQASDGRREEF